MAQTEVNPVVREWEETRWLRERAGGGELVFFRAPGSGELNRKDLLVNKEIVGPVLKHLGSSDTTSSYNVQYCVNNVVYCTYVTLPLYSCNCHPRNKTFCERNCPNCGGVLLAAPGCLEKTNEGFLD